jgi:uncharacterized protein YciI
MTQSLFAVTRRRGPRWNDAEPLEGQEGWRAHADFMNALVADGFVLLGGPLLGTRDALLIVRATDQQEIEMRLAPDPWTLNELLCTGSLSPWQLRLGSLGDP